MRPIDAEPLEEILRSRCAQYSNDYGSLAGAISGCLKLVQAQPTISPPPNAPLTLEELLEMDGERVYCITDYEITVNGEKGHRLHTEEWGVVIVADLGDQGFVAGTACTHYLEHYGKTWLAYRRKPEEAEHE